MGIALWRRSRVNQSISGSTTVCGTRKMPDQRDQVGSMAGCVTPRWHTNVLLDTHIKGQVLSRTTVPQVSNFEMQLAYNYAENGKTVVPGDCVDELELNLLESLRDCGIRTGCPLEQRMTTLSWTLARLRGRIPRRASWCCVCCQYNCRELVCTG